jgi:hypothetical protein
MAQETLDELLETWNVDPPGLLEDRGEDVSEWYAVSNQDGIIAYFAHEEDAFRFRLAEINRQLNG